MLYRYNMGRDHSHNGPFLYILCTPVMAEKRKNWENRLLPRQGPFFSPHLPLQQTQAAFPMAAPLPLSVISRSFSCQF